MSTSHPIVRRAFFQALATVAYISAVSLVMSNAERIIGGSDEQNGALGGVAFLLLFVLSASVTATLVLGTPVRWYIDGKKQEAVQVLGYTVAWLAAFAVLAFALLAIR